MDLTHDQRRLLANISRFAHGLSVPDIRSNWYASLLDRFEPDRPMFMGAGRRTWVRMDTVATVPDLVREGYLAEAAIPVQVETVRGGDEMDRNTMVLALTPKAKALIEEHPDAFDL